MLNGHSMKPFSLLVLLMALSCQVIGLAEVVDIPDPNLKAALEKTLGKNAGDAITKEDLEKLTTFKAVESNISNLTGLEFCTNLTQLRLYYNQEIADISIISGLTNLTALDLGGNKVTDISALSELRNLSGLGLHWNQIEDISPLSQLTNLRHIDLGGNKVTDISVLAKLLNLTGLNIYSNQIEDISPLAQLTNLEHILLHDNQVKDLSALAALQNLVTLNLSKNHIENVSALNNLSNLQNLDLSGNLLIENISVLANLNKLKDIDLKGNFLNEDSYTTHIPVLKARGVSINYDEPTSGVLLNPNNGPEDLVMFRAGEDYWKVLLLKNRHMLLEIRPKGWQGTAGVFPYDGAQQVGAFWSHFLMSNKDWLTDKVESEGLKLLSFEPFEGRSQIVHYRGEWVFRDLFSSKEKHWLWVNDSTVFHYVSTDLHVLSEIPDVWAIWVELMNKKNIYNSVATKVGNKVIERSVKGDRPDKPHFHDLDQYVLDENGWIVIYGARQGQKGSVALVPINSSHPVRPRLYDSHVDNIELHMLDPNIRRMLSAKSKFHLDYLLLISPQTETWEWVEGAIAKSKDIISYIGEASKPAISFSSASEVKVDDLFTVDVLLEGATDLAGWQMDLLFNKDILEFKKIEEGSFLKKGGAQTFWQSGKSDIGSGTVSGVNAAFLGQGGVSGAGKLLTITFKAKKAGTSTLDVGNLHLGDPLGETIHHRVATGRVTVIDFPAWDVNKDGSVNIFDLILVAQNFGQESLSNPRVDVKQDGVVNIFDLILVAQHFGETTDIAAPAVLANELKFTTQQKRNIQSAIVELEGIPARSQAEELVLNLLVAILPERLPEQTQLLPNYPNPFNPETWIPFELSQDSEVSVTIYDVSGTPVRNISVGYLEAGRYVSQSKAIYWDGKTDTGERVASGIYLYQIQVGDYTETRKMVILK